ARSGGTVTAASTGRTPPLPSSLPPTTVSPESPQAVSRQMAQPSTRYIRQPPEGSSMYLWDTGGSRKRGESTALFFAFHIFVIRERLVATEAQQGVHRGLVGGGKLESVELAGADPAEVLDASLVWRLVLGDRCRIQGQRHLVIGIDGGPLREPGAYG